MHTSFLGFFIANIWHSLKVWLHFLALSNHVASQHLKISSYTWSLQGKHCSWWFLSVNVPETLWNCPVDQPIFLRTANMHTISHALNTHRSKILNYRLTGKAFPKWRGQSLWLFTISVASIHTFCRQCMKEPEWLHLKRQKTLHACRQQNALVWRMADDVSSRDYVAFMLK